MKKINLSTLCRVFVALIFVMCVALLIAVNQVLDGKDCTTAYLVISGILVCLIIGAVIVNEIYIHSNYDNDEKAEN